MRLKESLRYHQERLWRSTAAVVLAVGVLGCGVELGDPSPTRAVTVASELPPSPFPSAEHASEAPALMPAVLVFFSLLGEGQYCVAFEGDKEGLIAEFEGGGSHTTTGGTEVNGEKVGASTIYLGCTPATIGTKAVECKVNFTGDECTLAEQPIRVQNKHFWEAFQSAARNFQTTMDKK